MSRSIRYLFGLWVGAVVVAALAAFDLLYLMTGKLLLPGEGGVKLVTKNAAIQGLEALIEEVAEGEYE
ncbi:MAG: hypothetical protein U9R48_00425 [Chloroflexota bacterium]|nr:hypothetical protein [Chloroflexota bacterium]